MSTVITHALGTITPAALRGWNAASEARSIVHTILGRSEPDVTLRPTGLRSGELTLVFSTGAAAYAARAVLVRPQSLTLANVDVAQVSMTFIVAGGEISEVLADTGDWTFTVPFQEIGS